MKTKPVSQLGRRKRLPFRTPTKLEKAALLDESWTRETPGRCLKAEGSQGDLRGNIGDIC